ncbi:RING finger protein 24 isoform X1 [Cottoperca gobio]|uniref:RING finger protein 24 isoform X1 n=2 Tax=Cottoperca gobio TaxID=56716 RepID=A0A6J2QQS6_COTGO|nr:RING finger protein 24 isoform X1 [Cottoperca gobio]
MKAPLGANDSLGLIHNTLKASILCLSCCLSHQKICTGQVTKMKPNNEISMSSDFPHYSFRMPNIGFQNLPLNIYIVVFGTAIFVFILSLLFCCYLIRLRHQAHKELYAYKQVIQKEKVKELNLHEICAVCLEEFKQKDELGICPCKHAFHRKCLIKWLEVRKVCPLCNMPVLQLAQQAGSTDPPLPIQQPLPGIENLV